MNNIGMAFAMAKQHLVRSGEEYRQNIGAGDQLQICLAVNTAYHREEISLEEMMACKSIIRKRLGDFASLTQWLKHNLPSDKAQEVTYDAEKGDYGLIQKHRHEWLDQLILEFYDVDAVAYVQRSQ